MLMPLFSQLGSQKRLVRDPLSSICNLNSKKSIGYAFTFYSVIVTLCPCLPISRTLLSPIVPSLYHFRTPRPHVALLYALF